MPRGIVEPMRAWAAVLLGLCGCYHPTVAPEVPCSAEGHCPDNQVCDFGRSPPTCVQTIGDAPRSIDVPVPDDAPTDARIDARPVDARPIDGPVGPPPILFKQAAMSKPTAMVSTLAFPGSVGAHHAIVVCLNFPVASGATLTSITDSLNNTYSVLVGPFSGAGDLHYIAAAYDTAAGADTLTISFSIAPTTGGGTDLMIMEYSGVALANAFDVHAEATGTGTAMDSGPATTTFGHELIVGYAEAPAATPGSAFTERALQTGNLTEDQIVTAIGTYDATATTTTGTWTMMMATFKGQ